MRAWPILAEGSAAGVTIARSCRARSLAPRDSHTHDIITLGRGGSCWHTGYIEDPLPALLQAAARFCDTETKDPNRRV
jgi:hypothetical protein